MLISEVGMGSNDGRFDKTSLKCLLIHELPRSDASSVSSDRFRIFSSMMAMTGVWSMKLMCEKKKCSPSSTLFFPGCAPQSFFWWEILRRTRKVTHFILQKLSFEEFLLSNSVRIIASYLCKSDSSRVLELRQTWIAPLSHPVYYIPYKIVCK